MARSIVFREISYRPNGYYGLLGILVVVALAGLVAAGYMGQAGHHVTGMSNQIVWGVPHVFSLFLILAAAGALGVASIANVFGRAVYKPMARLSAILAMALLLGGLSVLVLDLGRPGRLPEILPSLNFSSVFAVNLFVYSGFLLAALASLWMMIERRMNRYTRPVGLIALLMSVWLATDVGSVFGVVVARPAYDTAILPPLFVVTSFAVGLATFILILVPALTWSGRPLGDYVIGRLGRMLGIAMAVVLYFVAMQHIIGHYSAERQGAENFILSNGGIYTLFFWVVQVVLGSLVPIVLLFNSSPDGRRVRVMSAATLVILGGLAQIYVIIIGGQAFPLLLFPGMETASSFFDGQVASYVPSLSELVLGAGGVSFALILVAVAVKVLPVLPMTMADAVVDPHYQPPEEVEEEEPEAEEQSEEEPAAEEEAKPEAEPEEEAEDED
jgi:molybdopterin-containing oxidoreductase family membrane subunit